MKNLKRIASAALILLFTAGIIGQASLSAAPGQVTIRMTASVVKIVNDGSKKTFEGGWDPRKITVTQGEDVTLIITSLDMDHSMYLPDYGIDRYIPSGQTVTVKFNADKAGVFTFRCGDETKCGATHRYMVGQLIVNAPDPADAGK